ncbi:hypothetical protein [Brevibacillus laterosporus]|uniref:hypothetical protein n=1 Tax=Brevibacillus laterosporus TaxID=1465 RepID=UPI00265D310E|nr:hypothetical protein [Brevibacillus laterosporus]
MVTPVLKQETEADFINTILILRNQLRNDMTYKELLLQTREMLTVSSPDSFICQ